jgi:spore coat protein A, manganese oxidase
MEGNEMKITRREFLKATGKGALVAGVAMALPLKFGVGSVQAFANSGNLTKWATGQTLRGLNYPAGHILATLGYPNDPNGIPVLGGIADPVFPTTTMYQIGVKNFTDILHPQLGPTTLWGYYDLTRPIQKHLAGIVVTTRNQAARMRFTNQLPTRHIIPVDTTIPGANLAENRTATHIHGGLVPWISDGGPFDWFDPNGASGLSFLNGPADPLLFPSDPLHPLDNILTQPMLPGQADYYYPNDQSTRLVWYHDHAWGITRINAYAGIASGYLIVDLGNDAARLTANVPQYADLIPLVFQDKIFVSATTPAMDPTWATAAPMSTAIGSLWYAHVYDPKLYKLLKSPKYFTPPDPSIVPEFFGDTMLTNGTVYPTVTVQPKAYRFMILNACNARFLNINLFDATPVAPATTVEVTTNPKTGFAAVGTTLGPVITQIGTEAGYLAADVAHPGNTPVNPATMTGNLLLGPAERADVVIDFSAFAGKSLIMYNDAPAPFPVGAPTNDYYLGNPANPVQPLAGTGPDTRNILRIDVAAGSGTANNGPFLIPITVPTTTISSPNIDPPAIAPITALTVPIAPLVPPTAFVRDLTLNEDFDQYGRLRQTIGTTKPVVGGGFGLEYVAPPTEVVAAGATEVWRIFNLTADTHPIHFHLVNVQILLRQPFKVVNGVFTLTGVARGPEPEELGWKETVKMHPGEVTSVIMKFDLPPIDTSRVIAGSVPFVVPPSPRTGGNEYVYHCHILEHEEHDMMRPLVVGGTLSLFVNQVQPPPPGVISGVLGGTAAYDIGGGTAPYTVVSNNPTYKPALVAGGNGFTVTVKKRSAIAVVTFTVTDALGATTTATLTIV